MKRIYILFLACMGAMSVMAQGQKLKNRIIDKDYYPVDSAKVTVKGTNISTVTDKNGNFVIDNVPLVLDSIEIQKEGKKTYSAEIPVRVEMRRAVMDRFSWLVRAGWEYPLYDFDNVSDCSGSHVFFAGVGVDLKMSRHMSFQPSVNLSVRKMNGYGEFDKDNGYFYGEQIYNAGVLEIPLQFALKYRAGRSMNVVFRFGPHMDIGLWGNAKFPQTEEYDEAVLDIYGSRIGGGITYGLGVEWGHYIIGTTGHTGWIANKAAGGGCGYTSFGFEVGYRF